MMRIVCLIAVLLAGQMALGADERPTISRVILGVHGGTGLHRNEMTPDLEKKLRSGLEQALRAGEAVLRKQDGTSLDAVEAAIRVLEDDPWFNAGRGAVFTRDGRNELDASIMEGRTRKAGSVASVTTIKNPISAARGVMERTKHVMLIGRGAEQFAQEAGFEIVDPSYFRTEERWQQLLDDRRKEAEEQKKQQAAPQGAAVQKARPHEWGTVGAVAVDGAGNLAAGTSTGGMSFKRYGRVGDSPIIGAGTFADNATCAVSCTGHGEFFIRWSVSHEIASLMRYKGLAVGAAADDVIRRQLLDVGGEGAAIALDRQGNFAMSYNTDGLYRGYVTSDGKVTVLLYER